MLALLLVWEITALVRWLNPLLVPAPSQVARALYDLLQSGRIWVHFGTTVVEAIGGLILGVIAGGVLGSLAALWPGFADLLQPVMSLLNAVPRVILAPLLIIWFGIGVASKIVLSFVLVAVTVFFAMYSGIREVDPRLVDRARALGATRLDLVREVYVPSVASWLLGSLKIAVGFAFTGAVVGEFVASSRGLGYLLSFAQSTYNVPLTMALICLVVAVTYSLFAACERLERRAFRWRQGRPAGEPASRTETIAARRVHSEI